MVVIALSVVANHSLETCHCHFTSEHRLRIQDQFDPGGFVPLDSRVFRVTPCNFLSVFELSELLLTAWKIDDIDEHM